MTRFLILHDDVELAFDLSKMTLKDVIDIVINTNNAYLHWCRLYPSETNQLRIGYGFVGYIINPDETLSFYTYGEKHNEKVHKAPELHSRPNVYMVFGQDVDARIHPRQHTAWEIIEDFLENERIELKIVRGEKGYAQWGEITYQINGFEKLKCVASHVDSSG